MSQKARTPIVEYEEFYAIELPGSHPPHERDRLSDQRMVVAYDFVPKAQPRWRLRALHFDREHWTRSGIRRWWAVHEVHLLAQDQMDDLVPELCRSYESPGPHLPTIALCHRNTPQAPLRQQMQSLAATKRPGHGTAE